MDNKPQSSTVNELNRGGQVLMHFVRMLHQTLKRYFKLVGLVFALSVGLLTHKFTDPIDWYMGLKYYYSYIFVEHLGMTDGLTSLRLPDGRTVNVKDAQIVNSSKMQMHAAVLYQNLLKSVFFSSLIAFAAAWYLFKFIIKKGKSESKEEHLRGTELVALNDLKEQAKDRVREDGRPSRISIASVPLIRFQENSGIALVGSPGTGKSTTARDILRQIRAQKHKAVLYDISGEFTKRFYRPGKDIILNVFDTRSHSWDFWAEGKNPATYDRLAKAAIPDHKSGGDPFWTEAPRLLFSALLEQLGKRFKEPRVDHLMNIILRMPNDKIAQVVATTDARNVMNLELDKLAGSVRAVITAYTRNFKHLSKTTGPRFSFREWAKNEDSDAWVFITVRDDMKDTLKPLMTMMIESALSAILTLETSMTRIIATGLDEIGTLHEIPTLIDFIATGRKFGGLPILGFQSDAQLHVTYGEKKAQILMDSIGSLAAFRINGIDGAKWLASQLGDQEIEKPAENTSFGANDMRDATSINRTSKEQNLILKSEITKLPDFTCYLRLGRGLPVAKVKFPFDHMPELHPGIIEVKALKDESFMSVFSQENEVTPEDVVAIVQRDIENAELKPQKFNVNAAIDEDTSKSSEQLLEDVISKFSGANSKTKDTSDKNLEDTKSAVPVPATQCTVNTVEVSASSETLNPVALAMQVSNSGSSSSNQSEDDSDFSQMNSEDHYFQQIIGDYANEFAATSSPEKQSDLNSGVVNNSEKTMNLSDYDGGF